MPNLLKSKGINLIEHWSGRNKKLPNKLPKNTDLIVVYTQKINHELSWRVKLLAKESGMEPLYVRGTAELQAKLNYKVV